MATKKKMLQAAAGNAAAYGGAGGLNVEQVFSTYLYDGNGGGHIIENGINLGQSNSGGGIYFPDGDGDYLQTATLPALSGEFTFELWFYSYDTDRAINLLFHDGASTNLQIKTDYLSSSGNIYVEAAGTSFTFSGTGYTDPDGWNHIAVVRNSANRITCFLNGTRRSTQSPISATIPSSTYSIGSDSTGASASGYELMYGYMSSVRISDTARYDPTSASITVPTSAFTSDSNTVLLLGQGDTPLADASSNSYSVTVNGNPRASEVGPFDAADAGEGGLVWFKNRDSATNPHQLYDTERGVTKRLKSDSTDPEQTASTGLLSFNSSGFSIGSASTINSNGESIASWTFRKAPKFFTCVQYTGTGSSLTINHDLGVEPAVIIIKRTNTTGNWIVFTDVVDGTMDYLYLNDTSASADGSTLLSKSSTSFTLLQSFLYGNASGSEYVAYLFAHNDGDGDFGPTGDQDVIRCGSYTGNGSSTGPEIDLGFEPQWVMIKNATTVRDWHVFDVMRGLPTGGNDTILKPNLSDAEISVERLSVTPTGFNLSTTHNSVNGSGDTYIYIAIRRGPMAVPTDATDVFDVSYGTSNGNTPINLGFSTDTMLYKNTSGSDSYIAARLTGSQYLSPNSTAAEGTGGDVYWDDMDGIAFNNASSFTSWIFYNWKRAPSFCDVVAYTGNGTAGRTVSHNLGVAPEMMWVKRRSSAEDWLVYHSSTGNQAGLGLNETAAAYTGVSTFWNSTTPTDSVFTLGTHGRVNTSGQTYIAYLFASLDGVSKVGSFTHTNGTTTNVDCGFSNGARFVLLKRYNTTGSWIVFDAERGIVSGNDPYLALDTTNAEVTSNDVIDPYSSGFTVASGFLATGDWIFYAIA